MATKATTTTRTMVAEIEITENGTIPATAPAIEEQMQRLVEPKLHPDDPWAITKIDVTEPSRHQLEAVKTALGQ